MSENICLPKIHMIIIFIIFIGLTAWYIHNDKKKHINDPNYKYNDMILDNLRKSISELKNKTESYDIERKKFLNHRDKEVLYNDFVAPERRQQEYSYPYNYVKNQLNIPSRGLPDNYHLMGVLLRNNTESAFNLFGRQTYVGSNQWEYYVQGNMKDMPVKIPIKIKGDREIEDGQTVVVDGTDPSKGDYKVKLYNFDVPRYNPYV
jgi:hypothetical protein